MCGFGPVPDDFRGPEVASVVDDGSAMQERSTVVLVGRDSHLT